jgi:hypothetical protein
MEILLILLVGALNIACFFVGAKVGQQVSKGEKITVPEINPLKLWEDRQDRKEAEKERNKMDVILSNIETYDGTSVGQKDIPR